MGLFDSLQGKWAETTQNIQTGRFDTQIGEVDRKLKEQTLAIGSLYLEKHREDYEAEFTPYMEAIRKLEEEKRF